MHSLRLAIFLRSIAPVCAAIALFACSRTAGAPSCAVDSRTIPAPESNGMGGIAFSYRCPDAVPRAVECTSTVAGNPASAAMTCQCKAGDATTSFTLSPSDRGKLVTDASSTAFVNTKCGWSMPTP
jgi:hypothetical protein